MTAMKSALTFVTLLAAMIAAGVVYSQTMVVADISEETGLLLETASGVQYHFMPETGYEEFEVGDVASAIMYYAGTPDDLQDDEIVTLRNSGFHASRKEKREIVLLCSRTES